MRNRVSASDPADPTIIVGLLPRFFLGAIFALAAYAKLTAPHGFTAAVLAFLQSPEAQNAPAWYQNFVHSAVIPHIDQWATAVVGAELFVAASLLLGILTRVGAVVAIYLLVNYMFAKGQAIWSPASNDAGDIMLAIVVAMTGPGRVFGLDAFLTK